MLSFSKNSSPENVTANAQGFIDCYYFQIVWNHDLRVYAHTWRLHVHVCGAKGNQGAT